MTVENKTLYSYRQKKKKKKQKNKKNEGRVRARSDKISAEQKKTQKLETWVLKKKNRSKMGKTIEEKLEKFGPVTRYNSLGYRSVTTR